MKAIFQTFTLGLSALALAAGAHAAAQSTHSQDVVQLRNSDVPDLTFDKGYIVYETVQGKFDIFFLRSLTEEELIRFVENREIALSEERADLRERRDGAPGISDEELLPDGAFNYVDPNIRNLVRLDSGRVFSKDGQTRTYVVEVPPGEYTVFGAGIDGQTSGTCMCMGSVRFESRAGRLTDLGAVLVAPEDGRTDIEELAPYEAPEYIRRKALPYIMAIRPAEVGDAMPEALAGMEVVAAQYRAADKYPNFLGMLINRMPPLEGVLAYDADRVIDVQAEAEAAQALEEAERAAAEAAVEEAERQAAAAAIVEAVEAAATDATDVEDEGTE